MIPGSNLLSTALTVIKKDKFNLYRYQSASVNEVGMRVPVYAEAIVETGSVQAVPRNVMQQLGLEWQKRHIQVWTTMDVNDLRRGDNPDQVGFKGRRYDVIGETDWHPIDGWNSFMAVDVGAEYE